MGQTGAGWSKMAKQPVARISPRIARPGLGGARGGYCREPASHENNKLNMHSKCAADGVTSLWEIDVSIRNIFIRISLSCYRRLERQGVLLETHIRIT